MHTHKQIGNNGEALALSYLINNNLKLIIQNFHSRFGEIDLIMQDQDTTVFVEVKKRKSTLDDALESISSAKQKKLIKTAEYYLMKNGYGINCRFDAIAIDGNNHILWLKNIITG